MNHQRQTEAPFLTLAALHRMTPLESHDSIHLRDNSLP